MTVYTMRLSGRLDGRTVCSDMRQLLEECGAVLPTRLVVDFSRLTFVRPAGVTFLSNLLRWFTSAGAAVELAGCDLAKSPIVYLDDSGFFLQHVGRRLQPNAVCRSTTMPLRGIESVEARAWVETTLAPWMANTLGRSRGSVYRLEASVHEIFNNIGDHSEQTVGCVYAQHYPNQKELGIAIADFGRGIPESVRQREPRCDDDAAILKAVSRGFTTGSRNNHGEGLDYLLSTTVDNLCGRVEIHSLNGHVLFYNVSGVRHFRVLQMDGFCPGTTIDITLNTEAIVDEEGDMEDLLWQSEF